MKTIIAKNKITDDILKNISRDGWAKEQLMKDALDIWQNGHNYFFSLGDWAQIPSDVIVRAIKRVDSKADVKWDAEAGPGAGSWKKIF